MLDSSIAHSGAAGDALGSAARIAATKAAAEAEHVKAHPARRFIGVFLDALLYGSLGVGAVAGVTYWKYGASEVEDMLKGIEESKEELSLWDQARAVFFVQYLKVAQPLEKMVREYTDPRCEALLPDQPSEWRGRVKTLVLDLEGLLVHKEWSRAKGWQVYKRPGATEFINTMAQRYEMVLYTEETSAYGDPIVNKLDPQRAIPFRLYRQDTQYDHGKHVCDLSKLNRDLGQVLFVSANPDAYSFQPENTLKLKPWTHDTHDTTLLDLIPFLLMVQEVGIRDVRDVVRSYDGEEDVAKAFKARMASLAASHSKGSGGSSSIRLRGN